MPSYRDLLQAVKAEITEIDAQSAHALLTGDAAPVLVDVRELDEWEQGHLPAATHVVRGFLESRIEQVAPDRSQPVIVYCAGGARSAFAAQTLQGLGYTDVRSLAGGHTFSAPGGTTQWFRRANAVSSSSGTICTSAFSNAHRSK